MDRICSVETCKREAETYCYHCSHDVCTKHYLEHKKSIQEQLPPLIDEINLIYERLYHSDEIQTALSQCLINAYSQLDKWRADCHRRIDTTYQRVHKQIEDIAEKHKHEETQKAVKNLESLEKMRQQVNELLKEGDVTYRQIERTKQQLQEIKNKEQEPIKYPDVRIITQKLDADKYASITVDVKSSIDEIQKPRSPQIPSMST
jgi:SpoVK/Ycf46/Vps4 family AAA+-type ATPase